jgi:hypothetical protein
MGLDILGSGKEKRKMAKGRLRATKLFDIGKEIQRTDDRGKVTTTSPPITEGLKPGHFPLKEGYHVVTPEQLASLNVPRVEIINGRIHGFQRPEITKPHVRRISRAMEAGEPMEVLEVGLYKNSAWLVDGQHRGLAALMSRLPLPVVARKLSVEEMESLFSNQTKSKRINPSLTVQTAKTDFARYVQDAITENKHPWNSLVTAQMSSQKKLTAHQVHEAVVHYVGNSLGSHTRTLVESAKFDKELSDELATIYKAFGTKNTNPLAFRPVAVRAITGAAILIIRRGGSRPKDIKRWKNWMPLFPWNEYMGIRSSKDLTVFLVRHWNKRLSKENRVKVPDEE